MSGAGGEAGRPPLGYTRVTMIVCPVCEHAQPQGAECEVCGKRLLRGAAAIPAVAPVEGLEPTHHAAVAPGVERVAELEPTHHRAEGEPLHDPTPGVERTGAAPVDVDVDPVPDIERIAPEDGGDAPTGVPAIVTCRYCRTAAAPGERVCSRCGMRLPSFAPARDERAQATRLCSCGTPVSGSLCRSCGARNS